MAGWRHGGIIAVDRPDRRALPAVVPLGSDVGIRLRSAPLLVLLAVTALFAVVPIRANAQTPEQIQIVASEIVPEHLRPMAIMDQGALIDAWVAHEMSLILQNMVNRGIEREAAAALLEPTLGELHDLIETDWYGRLESYTNRDPRFADLTDRELLDRATEAEAAGSVCAQADFLSEFYNRNQRARADRLATVRDLEQTCGS